MINSMTGYGCAEGVIDSIVYAVEVKSVNNRYFKSRVKLPDAVAFLEDEIDKLLRGSLSRGTVNYTLTLKNISADVLFDIDEAGLKSYMSKLKAIADSAGIDCPMDLGSLLSLPGIIQPKMPDEKQAQRIKEKVLDISKQAIDQLQQMRAAEGAALAADLEVHCEAMYKGIEQINSKSADVVIQYRDKLKKRVEELLAAAKLTLDEETLAKEAAIYAEKSDISEEISRLRSHLQQFIESCKADGQAGRKLDFITQEMLREANTIASKASDTEIIHWVVDIKCRIDRIKEQVQNVE